ncbi:HEAT repeat family protein [Musa troglodytarum]|uniref:HEAT repeat family protein n=1 Tax=Musa troglodytarum TaxID=320322 RepID=A0A9E7EHK1_9LILI|nr:HEAT repeat family protein [Musa troglodytarum]
MVPDAPPLRHLTAATPASPVILVLFPSPASLTPPPSPSAFATTPLVSSALISAYSLLRLPSLSFLVFRHHQQPNLFLYNSLLSAFSRNGLFAATISFFYQLSLRPSPDQFSLSITAKAAAELAELRTGRAVHSLAIRLTMVPGYVENGEYVESLRLFQEMTLRDGTMPNKITLVLLVLDHFTGGGIHKDMDY